MSERLAGLYLHVPFCARICPYCDFAVRTGDRARRSRYVEHLLAEVALYAGWPRRFDTLYFGGGTPSSLLVEELARIVETVRSTFDFAESSSVFLEVNPEDVTAQTVEGWRQAGVETLSLGIQALNPAGLEFLGRTHDAAQARRSVELARAAGFRTVSIDLIYGLPSQTIEDWKAELERAMALRPDHISCYQLTIHAKTRFGLLERRGELKPLSSDRQADLFRLTHRTLNDVGMQGYEVSQFARAAEHRSAHNLKYWDHSPYLGLGPAAHSFDDRRRWWNLRRTDPWQDRVEQGRRPVEGSESLDRSALALEALMTGLRTYAGVDLERLRRRWGVALEESNDTLIGRLENRGLIQREGSALVPTLDGMAVADGLAARFDTGPSAQLERGSRKRSDFC